MIQDKEKQQHFLKNAEILGREINAANITAKDSVIEIGAGDGRLTRLISKKAGSWGMINLMSNS